MTTILNDRIERLPLKSFLGFIGLALASFLGCIDLTIVTIAMPTISTQMHTSSSQTQLILGVFLAALAMFMVTAGRLADQKGRKGVLLSGLIIFLLASWGAAESTSINTLIMSRFFQGCACAILYTSTSSLVEFLFPGTTQARAVGWLYSVNGLGLALGPALGAVLIPLASWRAIFWINLPIGIISIVLIALWVPRIPRAEVKSLDISGQFLLAVIIFAFMLFLQNSTIYGWRSWGTWVPLTISIIGSILALFIEKQADNPIIDPALFIKKQFRGAIFTYFILAFFYATALLIIPDYLVQTLGYSITESGLFLLFVSVTMAFTSTKIGNLIGKMGTFKVITLGFLAFFIASVLLWYGSFFPQISIFCAGMIIFGFGWALLLNAATVQTMSSVSTENTGFAIGAGTTFHNFGGAIASFITAFITAHYRGDFYKTTLVACGVLIGISILGFLQSLRYIKKSDQL